MRVARISLGVLAICLAAAPLRAQNPPSRSPQEGVSPLKLTDLVNQALERNPQVLAARRAVEAKRARVPQAGAWADPQVTVNYGGNLLPPFTVMRADPSSARQLMVEQMIPYPGKTRLRTEVAAREVSAESLNYEATWRRAVEEVKETFFELFFTDRSLETVNKDKPLLEKFEKVTEIRYAAGKASQQDILQAQLQLTRLAERETMLHQQRDTLAARLNSQRDIPLGTPVGAPEAPPADASLTYSLDDLEKAAQANYPLLKRQQAMIEEGRLSVALAEKERRPDFSVGYTYMQRDALPDMYGITFSTSLPVFHRKKQDMAVAEAAANLAASKHSEENELTVLRYRVQQQFLAVRTANELMQLYSHGIVPQSTLALESALAGYENGTVDFLTVISSFTSVLDYELNYYEQLSNRQKALAALEELTALNLLN